MITMTPFESLREFNERKESVNPYNGAFITRCCEEALFYGSLEDLAVRDACLQSLKCALPEQYHAHVFDAITNFGLCEHIEHPECEDVASEASAETECSEIVMKELPESLAYDMRKIKREISKIAESYFYIGLTLFDIRKNKDFGGYKNIYELCFGELGLKRSLVKNLISCFEKYRAAEKYQFSMEWQSYSFSQLVEMLPLEKEFIRENIKPSMSVREIKDLKRSEKENGQTSGQKLPSANGYKFLDEMDLDELCNLRSLIDDKILAKAPAAPHLRVV